MTGPHKPAISKGVKGLPEPRVGAVPMDCTLGQAGHARLILERITPGGRLLGIDRDPTAIEAGRRTLSDFHSAATLVQGSFGNLGELAAAARFAGADMGLLDFRISSAPLDEPDRRFSVR